MTLLETVDSVDNLDLCRFRCCCMPVLLVLDPTTSARVRRCSSLVHSLVPWAGNDVFRQIAMFLDLLQLQLKFL